MKICRFGPYGRERPGLIDRDERLRDLSGHVQKIDTACLSPDGLSRLAMIDPALLPIVEGKPRFGTPFEGMSKFICIGLNYSDHARESGLSEPTEPIIFLKALSALSGPNDDVIQPRGSTKLDWEVELGVIIGTKARYVEEADALSHVAGYCIVNDVSERAFQLQSSQWDKGKGCDTFGPVGPYLVTTDEVADPQDLKMWLDVNDKRMQDGNTKTMIFDVKTLVAYVSGYMTLYPGDIIATGTPPGVGMGVKPEPIWLMPGDVMRLGIAGLGEQRQRVVSFRA
ncbi:fumarylacetoacetate hydrolase family protein [Ensifer sp. YR511]|uniref:fumarylacetoacetate hydrolase family protein n=1 Tax=Ensifer sp. YR511 TaxID=1855294 RepID=UPI000890C726|nr:fumarylacetoacetate hydrolase family protein [Ensifer sp. YR511]SDN34834.1 2-keto-4-pentenoate hydratase/2-oxohepta-3-ene-1,7-dioic acid hydratase (catechol pathway) [Ensifer sp. YR511]